MAAHGTTFALIEWHGVAGTVMDSQADFLVLSMVKFLPRWAKRTIALFLAVSGLLCASVLVYAVYLSMNIALPKSDEHPPLLVYGTPFLLKPDLEVEPARLTDRLNRLGYHLVVSALRSPGEYRVTEQGLDLYLKEFRDLHFQARPVRVVVEDGRIASVQSAESGDELFPVHLEPQLISGLRGESRQVREWLPLGDIPQRLIETLLTIEDRRFYVHPGIDPIAVFRAVWANVTRGGVIQGGSTITQQLAKNLFYSPRRTFTRKLKESVAAVVLEATYRKRDILESYLNEIYLGQVGSVSIYGVREAAYRYFGKTVHDLTIAEVALIVGMIKGPNAYSPLKNPGLAKQRRDVVLGSLHREGLLTAEEWKEAVSSPLLVAPPMESLADAPYFIDHLLRQVEDVTGSPLPDGTTVYTTLDPVLQHVAAEAVSTGLSNLETHYPSLKDHEGQLQGALIAIDPRTGGILALVGGRDYRVSQFNRAVQAKRQPGSLFKPFVYLAAFEQGAVVADQPVTAVSRLADEPMMFNSGSESWAPQNYDHQFRGPVSVRTALEQSLNVPAVRMAQSVGVNPIRELVGRLGVRSPLAADLSLALGTSAVSLLEITSAYAALAQGGLVMLPTALRNVVSPGGDILFQPVIERHQVVSPQSAYLVTSLLQGVVERGTAAKARSLGLRGAVAGKTGTTDGERDAWFIGYSPDLVVGVWVGFDDEHPLRLTGSQAALPIWVDFMRQVMPSTTAQFIVPPGVVSVEIDPSTGQLATSKCPERITEVFLDGTAPTRYCEEHGGGFWERLKQTFGIS